MEKNWFITGASKGFGREFTIAALERGDRVAATARNLSAFDDISARWGDRLLPLQLDVTDRAADFDTVRRAHQTLGRLDIVLNNAGYGHFGAVEELSEADLRDQLETNLFGAAAGSRTGVSARAALRAHHPDVQHRRHRSVPLHVRISRVRPG
jgi:NAD(P)-dependent dehydrogenase (short-subunit alcohol dehydrogenase family)